MTTSPLRFMLPALAALVAACSAEPDAGASQRLGDVELAASCGPAADSALERGLALLHHMTYEPAEAAFAEAAEARPDCALAWWGQAMTYVHPLWSDPPEAAEFDRGAGFVEKARALELTDRERAYVEAVGAYYGAGDQATERPNLEAFAAGWAAAHERFPDDPEIAAFHALSLLGTADPGDPTLAVQRRAGEIAEEILADHPDHPGAHHYAIHAYDQPELAERGLSVARAYGEIAPSVPHALHMPSHIFTRLGLWDASIEMNARSAAAARARSVDGAVPMDVFHALDYLAYAHLQRGETAQARAVLDSLRSVEGPRMAHIATAYAMAAVPARLALETGDWQAAAALPARDPADYPWDRFPAIEAITHFARGIGAARSGDPAGAREAAERLASLRDAAARTSAYWADQVEIQRLSVEAWAAHAAGDASIALRRMREAAALESSTEKHPVTPGEIVPARELLGEMLLELGRYAEAREAFAAALERSPRRLRALYGAGRAAELAGDTTGAADRYRAVVELAGEGDPDHELLSHAAAFVSRS